MYKMDSSNRVLVISKKEGFGTHGYTENWYKVNGTKNPYINLKGQKQYLKDLKQIEDYTWNLGCGEIGIASQFEF